MLLSNQGNENNKLGLSYKLPRLVDGVKPYLVYYVFNENTNELQRVRKEVPKKANKKIWVRDQIKKISGLLASGYRIKLSTESGKKLELYTIKEAFELAKNIRKNTLSESTYTRDTSYFNIFYNFLENKKMDGLKIAYLDKTLIYNFLDFLKENEEIGNTTRNNYLKWLKAVLTILTDRGFFEKNPAKKVKKLKQNQSRSIAFDSKDLKKLKEAILKESTELYIFCMFVFYTFVRPIELRRLKVRQVDIETKKINVSGDQNKNSKNQFVMIPKPLEKILVEYKFLERNKDELLFPLNDSMNYSRNKFSSLFRKVIKKHDFNPEYKLYSWKHTGVTEFYKKGCGIKFIQMQCRHSSLDQTDKYLKNLGLFENEEILKNAPEI